MSTTAIQARDDCARRFTQMFEVASVAIVGALVEIRYQGVTLDETGAMLRPVDPSLYWVRFSMRGVMSRQSAFVLSNGVAGKEPSEYETSGLIFIQVFAPMSEVDGYRKGDLLAAAAQDIFRGAETPNGVIFKNVRKVELDDDTKAYRWNVIAEYEFSEVR